MKKAFLIIIILFIYTSVNAQDAKFDSLINKGISQIYNIQFDEAKTTFSKVIKDYPKNPAGKFFNAMIVWWQIMLDIENESYDDSFYDKLDDVIDMCDDILDDNPNNANALFFKGGAIGFRGRLYTYRESWFKAALDGKDALPLINEIYKADQSNVDVQLGFGIYNYYAELVPEKYPALKPLLAFLPNGDKKRGLKQLTYVAEKGKFAKYETQYFLAQIYNKYERDFDSALKIMNNLCSKFPNNPVFHKYKGMILVRKKDYSAAANLFNDILNRCNKNMTGYTKRTKREANYYLGFIEFIQNNFKAAIPYLEESKRISLIIDKDNDTESKINSILFLANCYDITDNRIKAKELYEMVLDMDDKSNSHKQAEKYLEHPFKQ